MGTFPGATGMGFQTIARQVTGRASQDKLKFVVVDPVMSGGAVTPIGKNAKWIPIKAATDGAFALAMIRWIIENNRYNKDYLSSPNLAAAKEKGFNSWTNATHLVIDDPSHVNNRKVLRAEDLGLPVPPAPPVNPMMPAKKPDYFVVMDQVTNKPVIYSDTAEANLHYTGQVTSQDGKVIKVRTAFTFLKESAFQKDIAAYAKDCGVPESIIIEVAKEFTSHGTRVGVDGIGGSASANGMDNALALYVLPMLVGAFYKKGGLTQTAGQGSYLSFYSPTRYNLAMFPNAPQAAGAPISRTGFPYEKTTEYKNKVGRGENPYPSKFPWYTFGSNSDNQAVFSIANGYPYKAKILVNWRANALLTSPAAARKEVQELLKNVENLPLFISADAFMGEMTSLADYIIPDTTQFEEWGVPGLQANYNGKATTVRWPVVNPLTAKLADGRYACYENYLIDVAKELGLPGFGDNAIPGPNNVMYPLNNPQDFFLKTVANIAYDETPVPDISQEERKLQDLDTITAGWESSVEPEEWSKVLFVLSRGGRFAPEATGFDGDNWKYAKTAPIYIYSEALATAINSYTGKPFSGVLGWNPESFADGTPLSQAFPEEQWPFKGVSYKGKFRSATMLVNSILRELNSTNYIEINTEDALRLDLKEGDKAKIISATGSEATGIVKVRQGIAVGNIGIAFGYGHWEYGARQYQVGDQKIAGNPASGTGILLNGICLIDPTVKAGVYGFAEMLTGNASRNGGAYRIEKA